jgi:hypothetical protein
MGGNLQPAIQMHDEVMQMVGNPKLNISLQH